MKAIIIIRKKKHEDLDLLKQESTFCIVLPTMNVSFLQNFIKNVIDEGITEFEFISSEDISRVQELLQKKYVGIKFSCRKTCYSSSHVGNTKPYNHCCENVLNNNATRNEVCLNMVF
ncbi:hypothetical protein [Candidatus Uabimicrobium amorphum]|uniref:Uncharacterized protein n=1 Tax=Uabimicrobium amorphum TaxID=2596890 RepID=A0A5S9ISX4_UABAM|nr:hypothetical protein [Candidatus Uabimicrobium amorphum]BBM86831.1 hypothetical protein UABAM_05224 [Candidatus Uabimicrobium amorphum]